MADDGGHGVKFVLWIFGISCYIGVRYWDVIVQGF